MNDRQHDTATSDPVRTEAEMPLPPVAASMKSRIVAVDAARGVALLGMFAVHVFSIFNRDGTPTVAWAVAAGRGPAAFALMAGISLALVTGGRRPVHGRARTAARAGLAMRALMIGVIGLALGHVTTATGLGVDVILPYYALLFLLAIPLLGLPPRALGCAAIVTAVAAPAIIFVVIDVLPDPGLDNNDPTLTYAVLHPVGLVVDLLVAGYYPALAWMAYICAGIAVGRLDLSSARVAIRLLAGGLALALGAWVASTVMLYQLGGLKHLRETAPPGTSWAQYRTVLLWDPPDDLSTWWSLAFRAPHSNTPFDLLHTLGVAVALLGALLLLTRLPGATKALGPLAAAGSMPLTLYTAQVLFLATGLLRDHRSVQYVLMVAAALVFGVVWRRWKGRGPLETMITFAASRARRAVMSSSLRGTPLPGSRASGQHR
jgi:uncharacterized membrane protein